MKVFHCKGGSIIVFFFLSLHFLAHFSSSLHSWSISNIRNLCNWTGMSIVCGSDQTLLGYICLMQIWQEHLKDLILLHFQISLSSNSGKTVCVGWYPSAIGESFSTFSFFSNNLIGTIPHQVGFLQKVWCLWDLGANYLETPDWSRFKSMPLLSHLCFYYNNLKLEFPSFIIPHCLNLTFLDLSLNQSTAPIP